MTETIPAKVWDMSEGGFVVRTRGGVEAAKAALTAYLQPGGPGAGLIYGPISGPDGQPLTPEESERAYVAEVARYVDGRRYREGWYRWNPCSPRSCFDGGGHCGHLGDGTEGQPGSWHGVAVDQ